MSAVAEPAKIVTDDRLAKRNAVVLAVAQALSGGNNAVIVSTGGIAGAILAPNRGLATLSITMMVLGMWAERYPSAGLPPITPALCASDETAVGILAG